MCKISAKNKTHSALGLAAHIIVKYIFLSASEFQMHILATSDRIKSNPYQDPNWTFNELRNINDHDRCVCGRNTATFKKLC